MFSPISETDLILTPEGAVYHLGLQPTQLADSIIVVGDPQRVEKVSRHFDAIHHRIEKREFVTHTGEYKGQPLSVISSGIGTDNVEILMTELDALVNINLQTRQIKTERKRLKIVRVGTSGSISSKVPVGTLLASARAVGLDTLMQFYDYPQTAQQMTLSEEIRQHFGLGFNPYITHASELLLQKAGANFYQGFTLTAPGFYAPQGRKLRLPTRHSHYTEKLYQPLKSGDYFTNLEMETAGYYALASLLEHDMLSLNAIIADRQSGKMHSKPSQVVDNLILKALALISAS
ncbi:MAG: nucleoside phosphorylase [Bernardetiaceae bacterium]|nr:nucleoside phosphorylase [Bernardetiaceae bacterium]